MSKSDQFKGLDMGQLTPSTESLTQKTVLDNKGTNRVEIPILPIVPIPNLQVDEVNITFDMEVKPKSSGKNTDDTFHPLVDDLPQHHHLGNSAD